MPFDIEAVDDRAQLLRGGRNRRCRCEAGA
jgi:hypothetical protein